MQTAAEEVKQAALRLSPDEREELAEALFASLGDPEAELAWKPVIARRIEELATGKVKGIPVEEVLRELDDLVG